MGGQALTGHLGARRNRLVALVTDDFRLYHELVPVFSEQGIDLLGLAPGEVVPASVRVLIGGPPKDPRSIPVREAHATLLATLQRLDGRSAAYKHAVVGIDPGATIGLALIGDAKVLLTTEEHGVAAVVARLALWRSAIQARTWSVQIGDGSPEVGKPLATALWAAGFVDVRFVAEHGTTPYSPTTGSRHMDAAARIGMR